MANETDEYINKPTISSNVNMKTVKAPVACHLKIDVATPQGCAVPQFFVISTQAEGQFEEINRTNQLVKFDRNRLKMANNIFSFFD